MRFTTQLCQILLQQFRYAALGNMHLHQHKQKPPQNQQQKCYVSSDKQSNPSAERNSPPIAEALRVQLDLETPGLQLLDIASGTGQHCGFLAPLFPNISFQPTELDRTMFPSISAYAADCVGCMRPPLLVDISQEWAQWPEKHALPLGSFDYMLNCNMMHISPWACSIGLFRAAGQLLKPKGMLFTYGPYAVHGVLTPLSNVHFDRSLKSRNPDWGVRDIADLKQMAGLNRLELKQTQELPSNNKLLTWQKLN